MNVIEITYDLRKPGRDYAKVYDYIKSLSDWCHALESVWLVRTTKSAETVRNELMALVDADDGVLCVDVTADAMAWNGLHSDVGDCLRTKTR